MLRKQKPQDINKINGKESKLQMSPMWAQKLKGTTDTLLNKASSLQCPNQCPAQYPALRCLFTFSPLSLSCCSCFSLQAFSSCFYSYSSPSVTLKWEDLLQGLHSGLMGQQGCLFTHLPLHSALGSLLPSLLLPSIASSNPAHLFQMFMFSVKQTSDGGEGESWGGGSFSPSRGLLFSPKNSLIAPACRMRDRGFRRKPAIPQQI